MWTMTGRANRMPEPDEALPGREQPLDVPDRHYVLDAPLKPPFPSHTRELVVGMGCFWGAERCFWTLEGVYTTAVGYAGGYTPNPTYEEVCSGMTGHTEVVRIIYDPDRIGLESLLQTFWESHDPTQGNRQGNDRGTQYRSAVYASSEEQLTQVQASRDAYQSALRQRGYGDITTEIAKAGPFYYAETYHQQYLAKNPNGYCGLGGTGVSCPAPLAG